MNALVLAALVPLFALATVLAANYARSQRRVIDARRGQVLARANDGPCARLLSVMADVTEQKKVEERVRFLLREMSHRSKNLLAVIQSLSSQTMRSSQSVVEFQHHFERKLQGLAASHDSLVDQNWQGATLINLVQKQMAPFVDIDSDRVVIAGPTVDLNAAAAQTVGLSLHELATNAVIARMAPSSIGGRVGLEYLATGLHWQLTIPASALSSTHGPVTESMPNGHASASENRLKGAATV